MGSRTGREERVSATRELILTAAERLFAEHGVFAVSNRHISEAAGQGNSSAVGYHFGTKTDLVRAIARKHAEPIERVRGQMLSELSGSTDVGDWIACLVRPVTEHLAELGTPTWYARFGAQMTAEPALREIMAEETRESPSLHHLIDGLRQCLPDLPQEVLAERGDMARQLLVHTLAERERALAKGAPTPRSSWYDAATGLIDATVGLWLAPTTLHERR